jgi:hypothetical protein
MTVQPESLPPPKLPFRAKHPLMTQAMIEKLRPDADRRLIRPLALIWDEVLHLIIDRTMALAAEDDGPLHINIREDMILELAKLKLWMADRVVEKRLGDRALKDIDPAEERRHCLGPPGASAILETATILHDHVWAKFMERRWKPKSLKAMERDTSPRQPKLAIKPVGKNHYIPRWFIRDNWAVDGKVMRWRRTESGWKSGLRSFGRWGFSRNLYSDRLEAYMALIEGDAKKPIEMLLDTRPLNGPQRQSLVGFLIVQILRSPFFADAIRDQLVSVLAELGYDDSPEMAAKTYEALYSDNDFYNKLAHPVTWSRWALIKSKTPLFVLPDTFGARSDLGDGMRMIVPLTPNVCFVTLPSHEREKRIVPSWLTVDEPLARKISAALIASAAREFLSNPTFVPDDEVPEVPLRDLLLEIEEAVDRKEEQDEAEALRP